MTLMRYPALPFLLRLLTVILSVGVTRAQEMQLPPAPENHVLDEAKLFTPEQTARLSAALVKAAREDHIQVYVATLHAVERGRLAAIGSAITRAWTGNAIGGTIVFDNQYGEVTVGTSDETDRRFTPLVLNMVMREPLLMGRKKGISPDKLEHSAYTVVAALKSLIDKERQERHGKWVANSLMALVALVGGSIIGVAAWGRRQRELTADAAPVEEPIVPNDAA
jgi:hypothetical protein